MSVSRRSLACNLRNISSLLHPSFTHVLFPRDRDDNQIQASPPCPPPRVGSFCHLIPKSSGLSFSFLPLGTGHSQRRYSSSSFGGGGSDDPEYMKDMADVFVENGADVVDAVKEVISPPVAVVGEVAAAAADSAVPVAALQHLIDAVHQFTGFNWWAAIAVTTVLIRSFTFPLMVNQLKVTTKLSLMRPELEKLKEKMNNSMDPEVMLENQKKMKELFKKHGVTPLSPLRGVFIQGPVFISFYLAISNMVEKVPSFKEGGAFWFTDLTTPDPLYALPVLTALSFLVTVELNMQEGMEGNPMAHTMKKFFRAVAFLTIPLTASFPKGIFCYWITSNLFSLAYGSAIKRPSVRRFLNIPQVSLQTSPQPVYPYRIGAKQITPESSHSSISMKEQQQNGDLASSSSDISQRIKNLEREVKERNKTDQ